MKNVFISSDFHYNHANICKSTSSWSDKSRCRDFDSLESHNTTIVENINNVVGENDELYHLGDWSFGGFDAIADFRSRINCSKIHLILGNHDHHIERDTKGVRSLFHCVSPLKEIKVNDQRIILCHYAMRVWNKSNHGSWMLHGHSHGTLPTYTTRIEVPNFAYKTMDVGIDCHSEFRPYHFDEIADIMSKRIILNVDHHNSNTN